MADNLVDDPVQAALAAAKSVDTSNLPGATLKPYEPTWKDQIANLLLGGEKPSPERERFVEGLVGSRGMGTTGLSVSDFVPVVGQVLPAQEATKQGDYRTAVMSFLPMEGAAVAEISNLGRSALKGLTYETAQHGPFYRISPRTAGADQPAIGGFGQKEWTGSPADIRGTGQSAYGTSQLDPITGKSSILMPPTEQNAPLQAANQYVADRGFGPIAQPEMPRSSLAKQSAIGRTFQLAAEDSPEYKAAIFDAYQRAMPEVVEQSGAQNYDQLLEASYRQMAKETDEQFKRLPLRFSFHKAGEGDYENSAQMLQDVHNNNHLFVFQGGDRHDFLHNIDPETGLNENEKFRAVHDAFGHAILGNTFGAQGEERAWGLHSQMYSPLARLAMTAETRGQNSFVNYTPVNMKVFDNLGQYEMQMAEALKKGDQGAIEELKKFKKQIMGDWQFAPQKAVLLPPEFLSTEYVGGMPEYVREIVTPQAGTAFGSSLTHFSRSPSLEITDPAKYGSGLRGAERARLGETDNPVFDRSYFYLGSNPRSEPGLGPYKYGAYSENLYDWNKDPANLWAIAQELNRNPANVKPNPMARRQVGPAFIDMPQAFTDIERLAKEYGYSGLAQSKHQYPMAIMFDPTAVKRTRAEGGRMMGNNALGNALRMARDHFDYGGDVRGGDSPFMSRSDYGLREAPTPSFRQAEDRSMREYNRAVESGWSPTGGGSDRSPTSPENQLTGRAQGFEGATPVNMPSNIGELLGFNRARQMQMQQQQQQQQAEQEAESQRIKDALAMASVGQTQFGDASALASGFPPVAKQPVYWGGELQGPSAATIDRAMALSQMPNVMGLPTGTTLSRTELPTQAEYYGAPQESYEQAFARSNFSSPQINAQFASAGSPYAVTPSAPQTMFAGTQPAFPHTPTPQQVAQVASAPDVRASFVQPNRPITLTPQPTIEQLTQTPPQQVAQNVPSPPTVTRDPIAAAVAAASAPAFTATSAPVEVAQATDPLLQNPDALVLSGRKAAQTVPMPMARPTDLPQAGLFDKIRSDLDLATGQRINELEAAGKTATFPTYSSAKDPLGAQREYVRAIGLDPNNPADMAKVQARIINQDGKQVVDYYTKDLSQALFGDPLKALGAGIGSLFGAKTGDQQVAEAVAAAREGGGGDRATQQAVTPPVTEAAKPPFMTELSEGNLALPHVDGLTAQQWANANTGGDLSKVHARIVYRNGAPRLEYYTV